MLEKLSKELNDENLNQIQDSKTISGVYVLVMILVKFH